MNYENVSSNKLLGILLPIFFALTSFISDESQVKTDVCLDEKFNVSSLQYMSQYSDLMDLYNNTNGSSWTINTNWGNAGVPFNLWYGIETNGNGDITNIELSSNNLNGTIPGSIINLTELIIFDCSQNSLSGSIPATLAQLDNLGRLDLQDNNLTGNIPTGWESTDDLNVLDLSNNNITGGIPTSLGNLPDLRNIDLSNNSSLGGSIPSSMGNFSLTDIHLILTNCGLTGTIPSSLGNLDLHLLYLDNNSLDGTIPSSLGNYTYYNLHLQFTNNNLSGCFPSSFTGYCTAAATIVALGNPLMAEDNFDVYCANGGTCCGGAGIDLSVHTMQLSSNAASPGSNIDLDFSIINSGCASAGASIQKWYLSSDKIYDNSDIELGSISIPSIAPNTINTVSTQNFSIPANQNTGDYYIILIADKDNDVAESSETNNSKYKSFKVTTNNNSGSADLIITNESSTSQVPINKTIYINSTVENSGTGSAGISILKWHISTNSNLTGAFHTFPNQNIPILNPGQTSLKYDNLSLPPSVQVGTTYYLIFEADGDDDVAESNENNNLASTQFTVTSAVNNANSDLFIVTSSTGPMTAGNSIVVDGLIHNLGTSSTGTSDAILRYYISSNSTFNPGLDIPIGEQNILPIAPGGQSFTNTQITIPDTIPSGTHYIIGFVDADDILQELNENNNTNSQSVVITNNIYKPNLATSNPSAPTSIIHGTSFTLSYDLVSDGEIGCPNSYSGFYLSDDEYFDPSDLLLGNQYNASQWRNETISKNSTLNIPISSSPGEFYILFKADYNNSIIELFENDNVSFLPVLIKEAPDLAPLSLSLNTTTVAAGDYVDITLIVENSGTAPSQHCSVDLDIRNPVTQEYHFFGSFEIPYLPINGSTTIVQSVQIPNYFTPGLFGIGAYADSFDEVIEISETNNSIISNVNIISEPDLVVTEATTPPFVTQGDIISLTGSILNSGSALAGGSIAGIYFSTDEIYQNSDTQILQTGVNPLATNAIFPLSASYQIPNGLSDGTYYILYGADMLDFVSEYNESNNWEALPITVSSNNCPYETASYIEEICDGESYELNGVYYTTSGSYMDTIASTGAGCDTIVTLDLTVNLTFADTIDIIICENETYDFAGNTYSITGFYIDSLLSVNECDSIVTLNLAVDPLNESDFYEEICDGESYSFYGTSYSLAGSYTDTISSNSGGCDTLATLHLTVYPTYNDSLEVTICANESYSFNGNEYSVEGNYTETLQSINNCDSIVTLVLSVDPLIEIDFYEEICDGESFVFYGNSYSTNNSFLDTIPSTGGGCDTLATLHLTVFPTYSDTLDVSICENETYTFGANTYSTSGFYSYTLSTINNCDSVLALNLNVLPLDTVLTNESICEGESYSFYGTNYSSTGSYEEILIATGTDCDTIAILNLTVHPTYIDTSEITICANEVYSFNGVEYNTAGTYSATLLSVNNCDSTVTLILSIDPLNNSSIAEEICEGETYEFNGTSYTAAGTYYDTLLAVSPACDTAIIITLTVHPSYSQTLFDTICANEIYEFNGSTYTESNIYYDTLQTIDNCDSTFILNLTVLPLLNSTLAESICEGESYNFYGTSYTIAGTYFDTITSVTSSCDTAYTLELTVYPNYNIVVDTSICEGETYSFFGQDYTTGGTYYDTLTTINNCDSLGTLVLSVETSVELTYNEEICDGEILIFNGTNYTSPGTYLDTIPSTTGSCDTLATLILIVNPVYTYAIDTSICQGSSYSFNGMAYTTSGTYKDTLQTINDCDSIGTLTLTVIPPIDTIFYESICDGEEFVFNGNSLSTAGTYKDTLTIEGTDCDSIVTIDLSVEELDSKTILKSICFGDSYTFLGSTYSSSGAYDHFVANPNSPNCDSLIILELTVLTEAESNCTNFTIAGSIEYTEDLLIPNSKYTPNLIEHLSDPTGGECGELEYMWQSSVLNSGIWTDIINSNNSEYQSLELQESTCFRRGARRDCQEDWIYSNQICFELNYCENYSDSGVIAYDGDLSTNDAFLDPGIIYESVSPSDGIGLGTDYQWQIKIESGSWSDIPNILSIDYSPDTLFENTCFRRKVKISCDTNWLFTDEICFDILDCQNVTSAGILYNGGPNTGNLFLDPIVLVGPEPTGGSGGEYEYQWEEQLEGGAWIVIPSATEQYYDPPTIYGSTCFRRGDKVACSELWTYANSICFVITGCQNNTDPGVLSYDGYTGFAVELDPGLISGTVPTGGGGGVQEYQWEEMLDFSGNWNVITNATEQNYDPPLFSETKCYQRKSRFSCQPIWLITDFICFINCTDEAIENAGNRIEECELSIKGIQVQMSDFCTEDEGGAIEILGLEPSRYNAIWNNGSTAMKITDLFASVYCVTITDSYLEDCFVTECYSIEEIENCPNFVNDTKIIVNEFSNGSRDGDEYLELLVIGNEDCESIDLRGFILDDNNGLFSVSSTTWAGTGISTGHIRFAHHDQLQDVPLGSILLLYNPKNKNSKISLEDDPFDSNNDGTYVIPIDHSVLVGNNTVPSVLDRQNYSLSTSHSKASWENIWFFDYADAIQIRNPSGSYHYGLSYGSEILMQGGPDDLHVHPSNLISKVLSFTNGNFYDVNNFSVDDCDVHETPGYANNDENDAFIKSICNTSSTSEEVPKSNKYKVYPNPFENKIYLEIESENSKKIQLEFYDIFGRRLLVEKHTLASGPNKISLNFNNNLLAGTYFLLVKSEGEKQFIEKVICAN